MVRSCAFSWVHAALLVVCAASPALAQTRTLRAVGVFQTGPNDQCGDQIWTLTGVPAGPFARGTFLGKEDPTPGVNTPILLTAGDCAGTGDSGAILSTRFDGAYAAVRGWPSPDPQLNNLALLDIPVPAGAGVRAPLPLPGFLPPNPQPATIAEPTDPIIVAGWTAASGDMEITCDDGAGTGFVAAEVQGLVPHRVYTLWGHWALSGSITEAPIGGLPNTIVADRNGDAEYCRPLSFCPLDLAPDGSELQYLSLVFHGDGTTWGAVPYEPFVTTAFTGFGGLPFTSTTPGGIVSFDQLGFRVNATGGPDPGLNPPALCADPVTVAGLAPPGVAALFLLLGFSGYAFARRSVRSS